MHPQTSQRIKQLRSWLAQQDFDALIIPHEDEFLGEYIPEHNERLLWATGFTGSAGAARAISTVAVCVGQKSGASCSVSPGESRMARSMTFWSSRMLPGQA